MSDGPVGEKVRLEQIQSASRKHDEVAHKERRSRFRRAISEGSSKVIVHIDVFVPSLIERSTQCFQLASLKNF